MAFSTPIPLSLYIHFPWCIKKCPYCDFNSHTLTSELPEQAYIDALIADFDENLPKIWGRRFSSIFIGGGTPSLFSPLAMKQLLQAIHARLPFHPDIEITLEANPGTVEQNRFEGYRAAGIHRLSLGIQSFDENHLKILGRIHDGTEARHAINAARNAGFENLNCDLMFGLPNQTMPQALTDLQTAIDQQPTHLSWYQLTIEPNTVYYNKQPTLPDADLIADIQAQGQALLAKNGFVQYEVSAYAKQNFDCIHNQNYWEFGDYLGIGAGAHSKLTDMSTQWITRHWNIKQPKDYLNPEKPFKAKATVIENKELPFEFMLNALRLKHGVPTDLFTERTGLTFETIKPTIDDLTAEDLLLNDPHRLCTTEKGFLFLNDVVNAFLSLS